MLLTAIGPAVSRLPSSKPASRIPHRLRHRSGESIEPARTCARIGPAAASTAA
ncbi:hypothetical protein P3T17_006065 [Paraburkholderia sp. GAS82]